MMKLQKVHCMCCMCGKLKVSVQKVLKYFGQCSGASKALEEIMQIKNCQSAWLPLKEDK